MIKKNSQVYCVFKSIKVSFTVFTQGHKERFLENAKHSLNVYG